MIRRENTHLYRKKTDRHMGCFFVLLAAVTILCTSCKFNITFGFKDNELLKIEKEVCTLEEARLFLANQQAMYQNFYGSQIWDVELEGKPFSIYLKEELKKFLMQYKAMVLMADEYGIVLSEDELALVSQAADEYYAGLTTEEIDDIGCTRELVTQTYHDYYLANKLVNDLTEHEEKEISEDDARVIVVWQILFRTSRLNDDGTVTVFSEEEKKQQYNKAVSVLEKAAAGMDFSTLAKEYNECEQSEVELTRGEWESSLNDVAFSLSSGEISGIVESQYGYHIIKCINNYEEDLTKEHLRELKREWKREVFDSYYQDFISSLHSEFNSDAWKSIDFSKDNKTNTGNFYVIYEKYFGE